MNRAAAISSMSAMRFMVGVDFSPPNAPTISSTIAPSASVISGSSGKKRGQGGHLVTFASSAFSSAAFFGATA